MIKTKCKEPQPEFWIPTQDLPKLAKNIFYSKIEKTLASFDFTNKVHKICASVYSAKTCGRPPIDPVVYLKMIMIGFFEGIYSERAIASRCADSIAIRQFLGYSLTEDTPEHSSLSVIRNRLGLEIYDQVFLLILGALETHGLLKGQNLGIDSSVIEANAALRGLVNRNTNEAYWDFVKRLAKENGIDPENSAAVRKFDRKRPNKASNDEWHNPNDTDAKIGPTKNGGTDMNYKPSATVDMDTGAIISAEVMPGNKADHQDVAADIFEAQAIINGVRKVDADQLTVKTATADKGYYSVAEMAALQNEGIKTIIADPIDNRRIDKLGEEERQVVMAAKRSCGTKYGKELLKKRGMHIERSFAHILDCGGVRRTTLRGQVNVNKRYKLAAAFYNLSQLMRKIHGVGTPKQLEAMKKVGVKPFLFILKLISRIADGMAIAAREAKYEFSRNFLVIQM